MTSDSDPVPCSQKRLPASIKPSVVEKYDTEDVSFFLFVWKNMLDIFFVWGKNVMGLSKLAKSIGAEKK